MKGRHKDSAKAGSLTHLMDLDAATARTWNAEEIGEIFRHQLATPLECDLGGRQRHLPGRLEATGAAADAPIRTFGDLLHHRQPPPELLELTKRFAKDCRNRPDGPLPDEIATVLYFLSIAAALTRCGRRITRMDDQSLCYSLDWALKQTWLDEPSRELLRAALEAIDSPAP